jgi:hypothetical protein
MSLPYEYGKEQEKQMSASGYAVVAMVIDFSGIDGTLVVAKSPSVDAEWTRAQATDIFNKVQAEYDEDYNTYADGKFDTLAAIKRHLEAIGAEVITYEQERYL